MQRDDDHDSNDDVFGESDLIEQQVRGRRGRGKKNRGRGKAQSQTQPLLSCHQPIQGSTQSKLKVPGQRRGKTGAANGTINPSAQSFRTKQIAGGSDFNFGSGMDIDMEQMMEKDLTQTQPTTNDGPIVSTAPLQLGSASWHSGRENVNGFAAQRVNIQHVNNGNEMYIPQQGHLAAYGAGGLGFQPLINPEYEQSEDGPEQDQGQQDIKIFQIFHKIKALRGLHKKPEGAKRIKAAPNHALNLPVRRRRAIDSANFASGWHMLMQVWRHQREEQLPLTPPQRSQTPVQQQQLSRKLMRYIPAWETISCKDFIQKGFYLIFKDNNSQKRLQQTIAQCPFQGNQTEMQAYKAMLYEELQDGIIEEIPKELVKWWNPTFLVPKPSGEWRQILEASLLNEEIQPLHFQMNGVEQVRYLLIPNDWAVTLDHKSAFHHLIVYPPQRVYLAFEVDNHHYQYRVMPFGCKHSPIFFTQALTLLLTEIRKRTDFRIINYPDDLLLLHQDKNWLFYQIQNIINTLEHFGQAWQNPGGFRGSARNQI
ncbi:MAG: hypothetical protein EZS28_040385 [Streblomastix strix]|uniref:Reverse transcriptase domain-containing protein n=1 Tax=Streblomastix strix TaxID=222440 RepID=A0A5J4U156_9EUKA|nr:MAG: hypothetical protein EZS28_040385 [Streblomastix strix]